MTKTYQLIWTIMSSKKGQKKKGKEKYLFLNNFGPIFIEQKL